MLMWGCFDALLFIIFITNYLVHFNYSMQQSCEYNKLIFIML